MYAVWAVAEIAPLWVLLTIHTGRGTKSPYGLAEQNSDALPLTGQSSQQGHVGLGLRDSWFFVLFCFFQF